MFRDSKACATPSKNRFKLPTIASVLTCLSPRQRRLWDCQRKTRATCQKRQGRTKTRIRGAHVRRPSVVDNGRLDSRPNPIIPNATCPVLSRGVSFSSGPKTSSCNKTSAGFSRRRKPTHQADRPTFREKSLFKMRIVRSRLDSGLCTGACRSRQYGLGLLHHTHQQKSPEAVGAPTLTLDPRLTRCLAE